jgi:adenylylsulfate kinase
VTGAIVWFTGLPASGKTTLARRVREALGPARPALVLDGDEVRDALGAHGYSDHDRDRFYAALANLAGLVARQGFVALVPATAPRRAHRAAARDPGARVVEVWLRTQAAECERRDPKGLYAAARRGEIPALPGAGAAYEPPDDPEIVATGGEDAAAVGEIVNRLG